MYSAPATVLSTAVFSADECGGHFPGESLLTAAATGAVRCAWCRRCVDGRDPDGRYMDRWVSDDPPTPVVWREHHVLAVTRPHDAHSLWLMWTPTWEFRCWYVQLQSPIVRRPNAIDTMDHALDAVIEPDGKWHWKDEDDFVEAQRLGVFTPEEAAAVRREGERVIADRLWITGWERWRP